MFGQAELKRGQIGEEKAKEFFETNGYTIVDVRESDFYRKLDIDLILTKGEESFSLEVKSNGSACRTGNLVVEDILNIAKGKLGWIWYCRADYLMVVSGNKGYIYKPVEMREYITKVKQEYMKMSGFTLLDMEDTTKKVAIDGRYAAQRRQVDDPWYKGSVSEIYYVRMGIYKSLGYYMKEVDL